MQHKLEGNGKMKIELYNGQEVSFTIDFTALNAVELCPTWGIIRYIHGLRTTPTQRQMPLECGSTCHEIFAAVRWLDAMRHVGEWELDESLLITESHRLMGDDRIERIFDAMNGLDAHSDHSCKEFITHVLYSSGYEDDDRDQKRTLFNMEIALLAYYDRWQWGRWRPWVGHVPIHGDMQQRMGIEIPLDLWLMTDNSVSIRYVGRMDGLHYDMRNKLGRYEYVVPHENKTAGRLGDAWESSMLMTHQITGYAIGARLITDKLVRYARAIGLSIPWPVERDRYHGYQSVAVGRGEVHAIAWQRWIDHIMSLVVRYADTPEEAPRFTHSCSRFFRPCSFIPLCDGGDFQADMQDMEVDIWSPLDPVTQQD